MFLASPLRRFGIVVVVAAGCLSGGPGDDGGEETVLVTQPVRCAPGLDRYPIAAPHNGGYDGNWSNFTCAPHPGGSPDNSDYGGDHHGNDLFAPRGSPVVAVRAGRVTRSGVASSTSGNRVTIEDDCGWGYYYGHLNSIAVGVGARVVPGQIIGTVGNTGTSTAPHVHFNIHRDGNYSNDVDPFPLLVAADRTACDPNAVVGPVPGPPPTGQTCARHCEGDTIVERDCSRGNCAAYAAGCVTDNLGPRCVFFACRPQGEHEACWLGRYIGHCRNGALISQGDCGAYGASCVADNLGPRCVFFACRPQGVHDTCWLGRYIGHCTNGHLDSQGDCGAYGANCVADDLGTRCVFFACNPRGAHDTCFLGSRLGRCFDGHLDAQIDCGAVGGTCVRDDLGARCVSPLCPARGDGTVCVAPSRIARCVNGDFTGFDRDCATEGSTCAMAGPVTARCVRAGEPPPPPFDAGTPPTPVDAGSPRDLGFPLPDRIVPFGPDAELPPADVLAGADVPPAADVPISDDVNPYFVPDAGPMAAEVETADPESPEDGKDPCAVCRALGRCPPQCDGDGGGAADTADSDSLVRQGCGCRVGAVPVRRDVSWAFVGLSLAAVLRRRRVRP